jgi:hypothetical protein
LAEIDEISCWSFVMDIRRDSIFDSSSCFLSESKVLVTGMRLCKVFDEWLRVCLEQSKASEQLHLNSALPSQNLHLRIYMGRVYASYEDEKFL